MILNNHPIFKTNSRKIIINLKNIFKLENLIYICKIEKTEAWWQLQTRKVCIKLDAVDSDFSIVTGLWG